MIRLSSKPAASKNDGNRPTSNENNNSKPVFGKKDGNNDVDRFDASRNDVKHAKKPEK